MMASVVESIDPIVSVHVGGGFGRILKVLVNRKDC